MAQSSRSTSGGGSVSRWAGQHRSGFQQRKQHETAAGWLLAAFLLSAVVPLQAMAAEERHPPALAEPSAAALERAAAHARANPITTKTWKWLTKATNAARGHRRWGHVLDAGTGPSSMSWLCTQPTESVVAVTAARAMSTKLKAELKAPCKPVESPANTSANGQQPTYDGRSRKAGHHPNTLLVGTWFAREEGKQPLTEHPVYTAQKFDTVLADYLLGALEHFAAFTEQKMMDVLVSSIKDDGLLLLCGRKPYPYPGPQGYRSLKYSTARKIVLSAERVRDAAMLLSHQREYREFPAWWVREALRQRGVEIIDQESFAGRVDLEYVTTQLGWARREARKVDSASLSAGLLRHIKELQAAADADARLNRNGGVNIGGSYCIVARKPVNSTSTTNMRP
eukprot:CAMPEP_0119307092 /NCGR_PEP_ID=MMETSP1333-20130426/7679_1 /TAXON_ID=418940 /ORGANISM="Scyphosphaera apsteinii, Strain RCC1455" /LENGTH=395 /DNA_ID=CAMNT_0007310561 /DNA_START=374 /DNA_END=1561 /DNA_ORIENTATION=-